MQVDSRMPECQRCIFISFSWRGDVLLLLLFLGTQLGHCWERYESIIDKSIALYIFDIFWLLKNILYIEENGINFSWTWQSLNILYQKVLSLPFWIDFFCTNKMHFFIFVDNGIVKKWRIFFMVRNLRMMVWEV